MCTLGLNLNQSYDVLFINKTVYIAIVPTKYGLNTNRKVVLINEAVPNEGA